ncbi:hypothetical protein DW817_08185, partial [Acidaminococcus sp. AM33-14BH]|uniref:hypothetical protein n=1 Tax=Acidaminococcus sp. AM33-14BH TaxID=2292909 RepID=UPI000EE314A4
MAHFCCTFFLQPADGFLIEPVPFLSRKFGTLQGIIIGSDPAKERPLFRFYNLFWGAKVTVQMR